MSGTVHYSPESGHFEARFQLGTGLPAFEKCRVLSDALLSVPFVYQRHEIVVSVRINGQGPFSMLLDTDTDPSAVDKQVVQRLRLRPTGIGGHGKGVGSGNIQVVPYQLSGVTLEGIQAHHVSALSADLRPLASAIRHPIDGVLGRSFLTSRILQIDFPHRQLHFYNTAPPAVPTARMTYPSETLICGVTVGGRPATATLDTGSSGFVTVSNGGVKALRLTQLALHGKTSLARGYNGTAVLRNITLPPLRIGRLEIGAVPARVFMGSDQDQGQPYVNIGNRVLERFKIVILNFRNNTFTLSE